MKRTAKLLIPMLVVVLCGVLFWRFGYERTRRLDNIPSLALVAEKGEKFAQSQLKGYTRKQVCAIWGEPDVSFVSSQGDAWDLDGDRSCVMLFYDGNNRVIQVKLGEKPPLAN